MRAVLARLTRPETALLVAAAIASALLLAEADARSRLLLLNTLYLCGAVVSISVPMGVLIAVLVARTDAPLRRLSLTATLLLLFIPLYLQTAAWETTLGKSSWLFPEGNPPLDGWWGAIWVHAIAATPWTVLLTVFALRQSNPELEELALLDAGAVAVLLRVTLRQAAGPILAAAMWTAVLVAGEITVTDIFAIRTYAEEVYTGYALAGDLAPEGSAASGAWSSGLPSFTAGAVMTFWLLVAALTAVAKSSKLIERGGARRCPTLGRLGRWRWVAGAGLAAWVVVAVGIPIASLAVLAGAEPPSLQNPQAAAWSVAYLFENVTASVVMFRDEFYWSLLTGSLAAAGAIALAVPLAWWGRGRLGSIACVLLAALCWAAPGPTVGRMIVGLLNRADWPLLVYLYDRTILAPWLAMLIKSLPVALLMCWLGFRSLPRSPIEAAAVDGAGRWSQFWQIAWPQRRPLVAAAWLAALAVSLGELGSVAVAQVAPPFMKLLSMTIAGLLHSRLEDRVAALCLVNLLAMLLIAAAVLWLLRPRAGIDVGPPERH